MTDEPLPPWLVARVTDGELAADRPVLRRLTIDIHARGVTALLGPSGVGKSALVCALANQLPSGLRRAGRWQVRGPVALAAQVARSREPGATRWQAALTEGAPLTVLDEPTLEPDRGDTLVDALRERAAHAAVLLVTHDLALARRAADRIVFLCDGVVQTQGRAEDFFRRPPGELAARFVATGNAWPRPALPALPPHFHWVIADRLAGMGAPGLTRDIDDDLTAIGVAGITTLVSLTETPVPPEKLREFGLVGRHHPIPDMGVPALGPTASLCGWIERQLERRARIAVHCHAGLGRTGTILASFLVWMGRPPADAIAAVRAIVPRYIQTPAQVDFVHRLADAFPRADGAGRPP